MISLRFGFRAKEQSASILQRDCLSVSLHSHGGLGGGHYCPHTCFTDGKAKAQRGTGTLAKALQLPGGGASSRTAGVNVTFRWTEAVSVSMRLRVQELAKASATTLFPAFPQGPGAAKTLNSGLSAIPKGWAVRPPASQCCPHPGYLLPRRG